MALVFGRCCLAEDLPWTACGGRDWLWKGLRKDLKHLKGLRPGKRQAWTTLKAHGPGVWPLVFSGRVALDGLAGGEIGFGKACGSMVFGRWCLAEELPWMGLRGRACWNKLGHGEGHGRDKPGSTPPVVPGAAPALAKAGVGGFIYTHILDILVIFELCGIYILVKTCVFCLLCIYVYMYFFFLRIFFFGIHRSIYIQIWCMIYHIMFCYNVFLCYQYFFW